MKVRIFMPEEKPITLFDASIEDTKFKNMFKVSGSRFAYTEKKKYEDFPTEDVVIPLCAWNPLRFFGKVSKVKQVRTIPVEYQLYEYSYDTIHDSTYAKYGYINESYIVPSSWIMIVEDDN